MLSVQRQNQRISDYGEIIRSNPYSAVCYCSIQTVLDEFSQWIVSYVQSGYLI